MNALTARLLVAVTVSAAALAGATPAAADTDTVGAAGPGPISSVVHSATEAVSQPAGIGFTRVETLRSEELQQVVDAKSKALEALTNVLKRTGSLCIRCLK